MQAEASDRRTAVSLTVVALATVFVVDPARSVLPPAGQSKKQLIEKAMGKEENSEEKKKVCTLAQSSAKEER
jgi:hypothetical protein